MTLEKLSTLLFVCTLSLPGRAGSAQEGGEQTDLQHRVEVLEAEVNALQRDVAVLLAELNEHKANEAAHHARYVNAEAIAAVGPHFSGDHADLTNVQPNQHHSPVDGAKLQKDVAELQHRLFHFTRVGNEVFVTGANLHLRNGLGSTDSSNGLGNIIIGYNEQPGGSEPDRRRTGSHTLVVGAGNEYTSFGGIVSGFENRVSAPYSSVTGGSGNIASGESASVSGGELNTASGRFSSVSGGTQNHAAGSFSSVSGGSGTFTSLWTDHPNTHTPLPRRRSTGPEVGGPRAGPP